MSTFFPRSRSGDALGGHPTTALASDEDASNICDAIAVAILDNFARESIVILSDGREIITAPDPEAVRELAREVEAAILARWAVTS